MLVPCVIHVYWDGKLHVKAKNERSVVYKEFLVTRLAGIGQKIKVKPIENLGSYWTLVLDIREQHRDSIGFNVSLHGALDEVRDWGMKRLRTGQGWTGGPFCYTHLTKATLEGN